MFDLHEPETWVAIAFVIFVGLMIYLGVHKTLAKTLDARAERIKAELDEASRLKQEAVALVESYRRKKQEAEAEAEAIVANAKAEAERVEVEAKARVEEFVARRTKMAETKIAQAEAQALGDVRAAAAEAAVSAAEKILGDTVKGQTAADLLAKGIADVRAKLN
ncbi:MAG: ATP F0F1 synthase subunit B [Pseudolabrys sp.]|nr:ATP F0F1 synthase subunit B [Pseudolabrys sp.]MCW5686772.1 ATP F0F1 synthase subunit B [Pseudolabrys sp.]